MSIQEQRVIGLRLGKKDDDLKRWLKLVKKNKLEQSFFFKKAILAYLNKEKIEIGRINRVEDNSGATFTSLTLNPGDTELLNFCAMIDTQPGVKLSTILKQIFREAITYTDGEEYIPSYLDMYKLVPNDVNRNKSSIEIPNSSVTTKESQSTESNQSSIKKTEKNADGEENSIKEIAATKELLEKTQTKSHPLLHQMFNFN